MCVAKVGVVVLAAAAADVLISPVTLWVLPGTILAAILSGT